MKGVIAVLACALAGAACVWGEDLKAPAGCVVAPGAEAGAGGWADRVIHEKTGIELVLVGGGTFRMGSTKVGSSSLPLHEVTIGKAFYIGKTEVTNGQYRRFAEGSGYDGTKDVDAAYDSYLAHWRGESLMPAGDEFPVVWVSWRNAQAFCEWAGMRLPTEAEWEYACRAGSTSEKYSFGEDQKEFDQYGWANQNSGGSTHPAAQKKPNAWGIFDMEGNVWEWTADDYVYRYEGAPTDGTARLEVKATKVLRGGSWSDSSDAITSGATCRFNHAPMNATNNFGFRVVLPVE